MTCEHTEVEQRITAQMTALSSQDFARKISLTDQQFSLFTAGILSTLASFCPEFRESDMNNWKFALVELSNGGFYTEIFPPRDAPCCETNKLHFTNPMNYFDKDVSLPMAGIIATTFGLSFLMERSNDENVCSLYYKVQDYGYQQAESDLFAAAID